MAASDRRFAALAGWWARCTGRSGRDRAGCRAVASAAGTGPRLPLAAAAANERHVSQPVLAALHARLELPAGYALNTLARTMVHPSVEPDFRRNNYPLQQLGSNLCGYYVTEHIMVRYPRMPPNAVQAAVWGYAGPAAKAAVARLWGLERCPVAETEQLGKVRFSPAHPGTQRPLRRGIVKGDRGMEFDPSAETAEFEDEAMCSTVDAIIGGLYLASDSRHVKHFVTAHLLSRHLQIGELISFSEPERELSRLCRREGFQPPVSRLVAETGRRSVAPVFVVGVYSGCHKLGEGQGSSKKEAKWRASAHALKAWYLYENTARSLPTSEDYVPAAPVFNPGAVIV